MTSPTIAYQTDRVTLWHGDSRHVVAGFDTESIDLILTDPPYGVAFESGHRAESFGQIHNDGEADRDLIAEVMASCVRVVGQNRHLYAFGPKDIFADLKVSEAVTLIWAKGTNGAGDLSSPWAPAHERITFAVSKHRHAGHKGKPSPPTRMRKGSVLRFTRPTGRKVRHPNEKPVALLGELIESSSRRGDLILDPFAGSGSTGVAAILAGRRAYLVESDERWLSLIIERLTAAEALADEMENL